MLPPLLPPSTDPALRLAAIVESSDDAIVSKDLNGIITTWNAGAERLFGYPAAEVIGKCITILVPHERLSEEEIVMDRIRHGLRVEHFETVRCRKDGSRVAVSVGVSPIRDASGAIVGASKIARDISAQQKLENEFRNLQTRLFVLAEASASILGSPDTASVLQRAIDLAREVVAADGYAVWKSGPAGWSVASAYGISETFAIRAAAADGEEPTPHRLTSTEPLLFEDVFTAPDLAHLQEVFREEGISSMIVFPLVIRGESIAAMAFYSRSPRAYRHMDVDVGRAVANLAAAAITTAELYAEQRAAREAADYARVQASFLSDATAALSASLDYRSTLAAVARLAVPAIADWCAVDILGDNGALERLALTHVDPEKLQLARTLEDRYPADPARARVQDVLRSGKPAFMPRISPALVESSARDGEHRRLLLELHLTSHMCVPLLVRGRAFGAITLVSAESGHEYSHADLRFAQDLATRASLAVENARAYARANEANRLKDEFLAVLSHELRTLLNAVLGYTQMLRAGAVSEAKRTAALDVVERNATALRQIIEDVLDVSRIVAGGLRLNIESLNLADLLLDACSSLVPATEAKGVRLDTVIDPVLRVAADSARIRQIIWNLLSNAIKFTPPGGTVEVRAVRAGASIEVAVRDTGIGIATDFLPFVFDRFRQADATFSREHGGLGLGLAIAKQLAELHGGSIHVASNGIGEGATFTVRLPAAVGRDASREAERSATPTS